jgi:hypothetical protein
MHSYRPALPGTLLNMVWAVLLILVVLGLLAIPVAYSLSDVIFVSIALGIVAAVIGLLRRRRPA